MELVEGLLELRPVHGHESVVLGPVLLGRGLQSGHPLLGVLGGEEVRLLAAGLEVAVQPQFAQERLLPHVGPELVGRDHVLVDGPAEPALEPLLPLRRGHRPDLLVHLGLLLRVVHELPCHHLVVGDDGPVGLPGLDLLPDMPERFRPLEGLLLLVLDQLHFLFGRQPLEDADRRLFRQRFPQLGPQVGVGQHRLPRPRPAVALENPQRAVGPERRQDRHLDAVHAVDLRHHVGQVVGVGLDLHPVHFLPRRVADVEVRVGEQVGHAHVLELFVPSAVLHREPLIVRVLLGGGVGVGVGHF